MNELIQQIAEDLKISPFSFENQEAFGNRVIYAALVGWIKVQLLGKSYTYLGERSIDYPCVTQKYITQNLRRVVNGLLQAVPHESRWLDNKADVEKELTTYIIEQLLFTYEINKLIDRGITASPERIVCFKNNELLLGGVEWQCVTRGAQAVGLGRWRERSSIEVDKKREDYKAAFGIFSSEPKSYYETIEKYAKWEISKIAEEYDEYEAFIPALGIWHAKAWKSIKYLKEGITLIRHREEKYKMMLLNYAEGVYYTAKLDKWYIEEREVYRIQYMLNAYWGNPTVFKAKREEECVILHCHTPIPNAEQRILLLGSWPYKTYNNVYERLIPKELWNDIEIMLNEMGVKIIFEE